MSVTNPPPIRVPQEFAKDRNTFAYFNELHTFLRLLWERTGGGTDAISEAGESNDAAAPMFSHAAQIGALRHDVDDAGRSARAALLSPNTAKIAALDMRVGDSERVAMLALSALPDAVRIQCLVEEVNELRTQVAALCSDRAKVAHLNSRVDDLEILSWL